MNEIANHDAQLNRPVQEYYEREEVRDDAEGAFFLSKGHLFDALIRKELKLSPARHKEAMDCLRDLFVDQWEDDHGR